MSLDRYIEIVNAVFITALIVVLLAWGVMTFLTLRAAKHKSGKVFIRTGITDSIEVTGYSPRETVRLVRKITEEEAAVQEAREQLSPTHRSRPHLADRD